MTTSLVTGGAGFIGSHVVDRLLEMGHDVIVLDDLSGGSLLNLRKDVLIRGSITDAETVNNIVQDFEPDYIFHLAAYAAEGLSHHIRSFNYMTNLVGSANLINAAVNYGVKRFVFTSSVAVYGLNAHYADEHQIPTPYDPYGIAKHAVELDLMAAGRHFGLDYTIFRPGNVYGPRQNLNDGYRNAVGIFMRQCLKGEPMTIFGTGDQRRQFTYIDDVAPHIAACVRNDKTRNHIINIGAQESYSVVNVAALVAKALGTYHVVELPPREEAHDIRVDHSKAHRILDGYHDTPLPDGIAKMAEWARKQELRAPKAFTGIEITKDLPDYWRSFQ